VPRYLVDRPANDGGVIRTGALLGAGIVALPSYFAAEAVLSSNAHPVHWLATAAATIAGTGVGAFGAWIRSRPSG